MKLNNIQINWKNKINNYKMKIYYLKKIIKNYNRKHKNLKKIQKI